jgi:hypothetical protein
MAQSASIEARLALMLVGTGTRRAARDRAIRALAQRADLARLEALLRMQGLLVLGGTRLEGLLGDELPEAFAHAVEVDRNVNRRRGSVQALAAIRWGELLERRGIRCLPLKGALLCRRIHDDFGLRAAGDVDLLVPVDRLHESVEQLREDGFAAPSERVSRGGLPELHFRLDHPARTMPQVELHWRIHWYEEAFSRALLARSVPCRDGYRVAEPADELAALLLFFARDAFMGLRLASDLAAWWDSFGATVPRGALERIAQEHPEIGCALATAASLADRLVGLPSGDLLDTSPAHFRRSRAAARLANWTLSGSRDQKITNYHLVDLLLSPPGARTGALRRQLFRRPRPRTGLLRGVERIRVVMRPPTRLVKSVAGLWRVRGDRWFAPSVDASDADTMGGWPPRAVM